MKRKEAILSRIREVPGLPASAVGLSSLLQNPDHDIEEIARTIEGDPTLATNLLRLANSAYYGRFRSIASVRDAILVVGSNSVYQMVFAQALAPLVRTPIKGYDVEPEAFWKHSVGVAEMALNLPRELAIDAPSHLFTAALLHDIGKVVLGTYLDVDAEQIVELAFREQVSFDAAEREVLGIDHAEVGALLLENWNIPGCVAAVVRWHHDPDSSPAEDPTVVDLVHIADLLCLLSGVGVGRDGLNYRASQKAASRLGVTEPLFEKILCQVAGRLDETAARSSPVESP